MNDNFKKEDLRIVKTQGSLLKAINTLLNQQGFKHITVNDLCAKAIISRAAFYTHFKDKYDLLKHFLNDLIATEFANESINKFLDTIMLNQNKIISNIMLDADNETIEIVQSFLFTAVSASEESLLSRADEYEHVFFTNFCAGGLYQVLFWQNQHKFPVNLKESNCFLTDILKKLTIGL